MIKTIVKVFPKAEKIEDFKNNVMIMAPVTRQEKGCISYQLLQDSKDTHVFIIVEEWENQEAFFAHLVADHVKEFETKMQGAFEKDVEANVCSVVV